MILTLRTDKPEAEIGLYDGNNRLSYDTWEAHRSLATTLHLRIKKLLEADNSDWDDITGIVYYKGPGSFTGLRIGATLANALAYANSVPLVAVNGEKWIEGGLAKLEAGKNETALPEYGSEPHITAPRK